MKLRAASGLVNDSILTTVVPWSADARLVTGPAIDQVRSTTFSPARAVLGRRGALLIGDAGDAPLHGTFQELGLCVHHRTLPYTPKPKDRPFGGLWRCPKTSVIDTQPSFAG